MKTRTALFLELWTEARTRFSKLLPEMKADDLKKKLPGTPNSAGFIIRHIGDVELLFARNVFGDADVKVIAKTVIAQQDTGEWTNLEELLQYIEESRLKLGGIIARQSEEDWDTVITTKEFGTKTKAEALGRIASHTAYHAGQLALMVKYGS